MLTVTTFGDPTTTCGRPVFIVMVKLSVSSNKLSLVMVTAEQASAIPGSKIKTLGGTKSVLIVASTPLAW